MAQAAACCRWRRCTQRPTRGLSRLLPGAAAAGQLPCTQPVPSTSRQVCRQIQQQQVVARLPAGWRCRPQCRAALVAAFPAARRLAGRYYPTAHPLTAAAAASLCVVAAAARSGVHAALQAALLVTLGPSNCWAQEMPQTMRASTSVGRSHCQQQLLLLLLPQPRSGRVDSLEVWVGCCCCCCLREVFVLGSSGCSIAHCIVGTATLSGSTAPGSCACGLVWQGVSCQCWCCRCLPRGHLP